MAATVPGQSSGVIDRLYRLLSRVPLWGIALLWLVPTFGLLVNSFRPRSAQSASGWWTLEADGTGTRMTLDNYESVLSAAATNSLVDSLLNSLAIAVPATIIPIAVAAFAAYGFAWIDFRGRRLLFITVVSLLAVPLQVALIPLLITYIDGAHFTLPWLERTLTLVPAWGINGESVSVWLTHTGFAMPFAIFLLHNYISSLPKDIFESARIDGADHFTIFWRLVLPLSIPVLAAFAIFQFLWTWNDYLIAVTMLGAAGAENLPTTVTIANLAGDFGSNEHLLTAGAFVQAFVPLVVFFALQRYFVRGLLAGSVKG
jgi:alpha-glucoside transport system permease protein